METTIPFCGFYYSEYSDLIDSVIDNYFTDDHGEVNKAISEKVFDNTDYKAVYTYAAKIYTEYLADELEIAVKFKELVSPKYYNFETDRIFCDIELTEVERIYKAVDKNILEARVKANFTSYDGFLSHYSNKLESWPSELSEWDHNQIGTLLESFIIWVKGDFDFDYYEVEERLNNQLYEYITDFDKYAKLAHYLNDRQYRESRV